jgi:HPt (histidine-containing phosphotransfer) domain-containing protein
MFDPDDRRADSHDFLRLMEFYPRFIADLLAVGPRFASEPPTWDKEMMRDALNVTDSVVGQVLDESVLDALGHLQGKWRPDFVDRVITFYLKTAEALLTDLTIGSAIGKSSMLHLASHTLKACSDIIGAAPLASLCRELEASARAGLVPDDAAARVEAIVKEHRRVEAALISRLAKQPNRSVTS